MIGIVEFVEWLSDRLRCISALAHLHLQHRIAHRDIKPGNIVVLEDPNDILVKVGLTACDTV